MREDLEKKAEELEQTLQMQLNLARKESEDWVKIGAVALASGIVAFSVVKLFGSKKKKKTKKILETLEREGLLDDEIRKKLTKKSEPGFLGRLSAVLLPIAVNYGKEQLMNRLREAESQPEEDEE